MAWALGEALLAGHPRAGPWRRCSSAERCHSRRRTELQRRTATAAEARAGADNMDVMLSKQELMQVTPSAERHTLAILQGKKGRVSTVRKRARACLGALDATGGAIESSAAAGPQGCR